MLRSRLALTLTTIVAALSLSCAPRGRGVTYEVTGEQAAEAVYAEATGPVDNHLAVFGAPWCGNCKEELAYLDQEGIPYQYFKVETREESDQLYGAVEGAGITLPTNVRRGVPLTLNRRSESTPPTAGVGFMARSTNGEELNWTNRYIAGENRQLPLRTLLP